MLSVRFHEFGDPLEVLRPESIAVPEAGSGQALVRLRARSVNPSDLLVVRGKYGMLPSLPATPGLEGAGEVVAVGDNVTAVRAGQRVIPIGASGTWQEMSVATADQLIPVPDSVDDRSAAQFYVNPLSAWIMTVEDLGLQKGEWLIQTAAASTLGRVVLQIARMRGFRTINIVRRPEQIGELKALGADEVICANEPQLDRRIRDVAGGTAVTKAIDAVGGDTGAAVLRSLSPGGTMIVYGALSMQATPVDGGRLIFATTSVRGFWLNQWRRSTAPEIKQTVIDRVLSAMASGTVVPPVEAEYPLEDFAQAIRHTRQPGRRGKILLVG